MSDTNVPQIRIPSIEVPTTDVRSLQSTVQQLKEAVELMSGQRGVNFFPTYDDAKLVKQRLYKLEQLQAKEWQTVYDDTVDLTSTGLQVLNLGSFRELRIRCHTIPVVANKFYMAVGNSSTFITAANSYIAEGIYNTESDPTPKGYLPASGVTERSIMPVSWGNSIATGPYGLDFTMDIHNFNKPVQTMCYQSVTFYNGSDLLHGRMNIREVAFVARDSLIFTAYGPATAFNMRLLLEGRKG